MISVAGENSLFGVVLGKGSVNIFLQGGKVFFLVDAAKQGLPHNVAVPVKNVSGGEGHDVQCKLACLAAGCKGNVAVGCPLGLQNLFSGSNGIRIVIELRKGADAANLENLLYKKTKLEDTFGVNMLAVVDGRPETMGIVPIIRHHVNFQYELAKRKYTTLLAKELEKKEVQEGLIHACDVIDLIIEILRGSANVKMARACLTEGITEINGLPLNFKVYHVVDVNAFACGDGSIRVFSALMDLMDDDELMAIIGHEIGHVVHADVKHAMKNAYLSSAARNAAGAAEGSTLAKLSDSQLGEVVTAFTGAQFSQKQEYAADEYGFEFSVKNGFSPYGMGNSLNKLVELSKGAKSSTVQKMFSSHPDSEKRAARMKEKADAYTAAQQQ